MVVGIVGLGYVGLPLAVAFAEEGDSVDRRRRGLPQASTAITAGESYVEDIPNDRLKAVSDRIEATTRFAALAAADAIIICVPTPLTRTGSRTSGRSWPPPQAVADHLQKGQLVVLESTTYPGTTRERVVPILEESGLAAGRDVHVAFSPERVDPGRTDYTLRTTPKVVGGLTDACLRARGRALRAGLRPHRPRSRRPRRPS